ncbi:MAG: hypothetical protein GY820_27490 [Gammaproteobacteria bacterium]|nr:hypothetical protein [Gammaproteobacteria bacterium]
MKPLLFTKVFMWWAVLFVAVCSSALIAENTAGFVHDETMFPLDFAHAQASCESCHVQAVFAGTPTKCSECHSKAGRIQASDASIQHIRTTNDCDFCHRASGTWQDVVRVDHFAVTGSCQSCHNGVTAIGKNAQHVQSSDICDDCHRTFSWLNAVYGHASISGNCFGCHNGVVASGKNPAHVPTSNFCDNCHRSTGWIPLLRFDHGAVVGTCASCHNGVLAEGKDGDHLVTNDECGLCHVTQGWLPATSSRTSSFTTTAKAGSNQSRIFDSGL